MNKILKLTAMLVAVVSLMLTATSCDKDFLNPPMTSSLDENTALQTPRDVQNALVGTYNRFAGAAFFGRNAQAAVDFLGDVSGLDFRNSNHLIEYVEYSFIEAQASILDIWTRGYLTIDNAVRTISAGKRILAETSLESDVKNLNLALGQLYGLKALTHFHMVNLFGLPYNLAPNSLGLVVVRDEPTKVGQAVSRSTVAETYTQILQDIAEAKEFFTAGVGGSYPTTTAKFYLNEGALYALEARVLLYMENWSGAANAAQTALTKSGATVVTDPAVYRSMWGAAAASAEDIFTVNFTSSNQLSANSMNNIWGGYGGVVYPKYLGLIADTDTCRIGILGDTTGTGNVRIMKYPNDNAINNNPVFRASEMYLIIAEAKAQGNDLGAAKTALFEVAQRNSAFATADDLPVEKNALLSFIADERARELVAEGHRWFDLRRTGAIMNRTSDLKNISNFDVKNSVLPIPQQERNASKIDQNPDWSTNRP